MKKLRSLGARVDTLVHPRFPEVKARVAVPDTVELGELNVRLEPYREKTYLRDPETKKYFRDKRGRPFYEVGLDLRKAADEVCKIVDEHVKEFEGLDLEAADQDAPPSRIAAAPELEYYQLEPFPDPDGQEWEDPKTGRILLVRWNEDGDKPVMRSVQHVWMVDIFEHIMNAPPYRDSDEGKDLPTPTT